MIILKTNIPTVEAGEQIFDHLREKFGVKAGTIDAEDCDKVFRVVGGNATEADVMETVQAFGYICAPLD